MVSGLWDLTGQGVLIATEEVERLVTKGIGGPRIQKPLRGDCLIFLHLFSGHRRQGDVQEAIHAYAEKQGWMAKALSVDVVISLKYGDLLNPEIQSKFIAAIQQGYVSGLAAGPPCETWSTAREHRLDEFSAGPRPVRSLETPIGLEVLSVREVRQVIVGNRLLGVALVLIFHCLMSGVFALLEPAKPSKPSPSIWKLPVLQLLTGHPDVRLLTVRQGLFGAKSSKPTDLLLVRSPSDVEAIFRSHQTRLRVPTCHSIGLQADGGFQTTELKAYPPALCAAIAETWGRSIFERNSLPVDRDGAVPDDFARIVQALFSLIGTSSPGPDYCQNGQYAAV